MKTTYSSWPLTESLPFIQFNRRHEARGSILRLAHSGRFLEHAFKRFVCVQKRPIETVSRYVAERFQFVFPTENPPWAKLALHSPNWEKNV